MVAMGMTRRSPSSCHDRPQARGAQVIKGTGSGSCSGSSSSRSSTIHRLASLASAAMVLVFASSCLVGSVSGVRFEVNAYSKCIGEEIQEGVLVVGTYHVVSSSHAEEHDKITVKVTSPYGHQLHWQDSVEDGHFGFTTKESGQYMACFWVPHATPGVHSVQVELEWKTGVAAKDWGSIAKKDKLDGMGLELRKLDEAVRGIRDEMTYFRQREAEMRDLNELTNARVAWLSIVSLLVCVGLAALQLWHLKTFFERKKLL